MNKSKNQLLREEIERLKHRLKVARDKEIMLLSRLVAYENKSECGTEFPEPINHSSEKGV